MPSHLPEGCEDWVGNNAAFRRPACGKAYPASGFLSNHRNGREYPHGKGSKAFVKGSRNKCDEVRISRINFL